jgi:hypothetical protein
MPSTSNKEEKGEPTGDEKKECCNMKEWIWNKLFEGKSAVWTAIATVVLAILTLVLVRVNVRLADLQQTYVDTTVASQRAFINFEPNVGPAGKVFDKALGRVTGIQVPIGWVNSGTTPTKSAFGNASFYPSISELPSSFDFKDLEGFLPSSIVIGPRTPVLRGLEIPITYFRDIVERRYHLYVWGWLAYRDVLPNTPIRLTEFCVELVDVQVAKIVSLPPAGSSNVGDSTQNVGPPDLTDPNAPIRWTPLPCRTVNHNCYDEGCTDYQARTKEAVILFPQLK